MIISRIAVAVRNLMIWGWLRPAKGPAHQRMNSKCGVSRFVVKGHIFVAERCRAWTKHLSEACSAGWLRSPNATKIGHFVRPVLYILPFLVVSPVHASMFPSQYDREIKRAVELYWPEYPFWTSWKSQLFQESRLDPAAVSPVGAAGLAQFMPGTWAQISRELRLPPGLSPHHAWAIEAGAYYMAKLRGQWSAPRPALDRHQLAQASYNAGLGHLLSAQRKCGGPPGYEAIVACLPQITGRHSAETIGYIKAIARWRRLIEAGG
jgi:hypothetical protein